MPKKSKYPVGVRGSRRKVASLLRESRNAARAGRCALASEFYNEAVHVDRASRAGTKDNTFWQMKGILHRCKERYGFSRK